MKTTLIIAPMKEEFEALKKKLTKYTEKSYGLFDGIEFRTKKGKVFCTIGKIGKANIGFCIGYLSKCLDINRIINFGVAGSIKDDVVPLDVVVADKVSYYDCNLTIDPKYKLGQIAGEELYFETDKSVLKILDKVNTTLNIKVGTIISADSFATKQNMTSELLSNFDNPLCVDMESGAVGQIAHRLNIPFTIIRAISDKVLDNTSTDIYDELLEMCARRAASITLHLLNKEFVDDEAY